MITLQKMIMGALIGGIFLFGFATDSLAQNGVGKTVSSVEVQLKINGNLYQGLQERIEYSVNRVGEKLLISQPVSLLESNKNTVRQTIFNVYSKVLTGFRTDAVDLHLGEYTKIVIQLTPQAPLISKIDVGLEMNGVEPEIAEVVAGARIKVETEINRIFAGLPVEATTWADNIFGLVLDYLVERDFPGFKSDFTIVPGETSRIKLVLTPQKPLVSELAVQYSSASLPMWLVRVKNKERQAKLNLMKGLPVEFLLHYQPQVERYLSDFWNGFSEPGQMGFETRITVTAGERTRVDLNVQSQYFKTKLEARYFRGEKDTFANLQGYLGYQTNHAELYTRAYLGENPDGYYKVGFKVPFSQNFYGGYEYDLENHFKSFVFNYRFERGDYLELDLGLDGGLNKAVVGLAINPHFNLEIVNRDKNYGLQLMYHFW